MQSFSKKAALTAGWHLFWKHPLFLMGVVLVVTAVSAASDAILQSLTGGNGMLFAFNVLAFVINTILSMGMLLVALRIHDDIDTGFADLLEPVPLFWKYVFTTLLSAVLFGIGFLLFIIPGIILELSFLMALYVVIDKELGPIQALKHSYHLTKGHRLNLFLFVALLTVLNTAGLLLFGFGLLVTVPVSLLSLVWVYRWLSGDKTVDTVALGMGSWVTATAVFIIGAVLAVAVLFGGIFGAFSDDSLALRDVQRGVQFAQTQDALATYQEINGVYPITLYAMVPEYLYEVPVDSGANEVLSYTVLDSGSDYELCTTFETEDIGFVCTYGSENRQDNFESFDFGE